MIPETQPYNNYSGDGSTTQFDFDFYIESETQLVVTLTDENGTITTLTRNTDYTIHEVGNDDGSYITYPISGSTHQTLTSDEVISLQLSLPISQQSEYGTSSELDLSSLEYSFDYITRIAQILNRKLERAVKVAEGSDIDTDELTEDLIIVADHIDNVDTVSTNISKVNTVSTNISNVNTVAGSIANVNAVGTDIANVNAVKADLTNIDAVKADLTNIDAVSTNISNVNAVANNETNINAVNANKTNIDAVKNNATNINAVAGNATNINAVNANKTNIDAVAGNATNINAVNANKTNINTVSGSIANVNTVAGSIANVNAVGTDIANVNAVKADLTNIDAVKADLTNIDAVSTNISNVNTCASNITAITDAPSYAATCQQIKEDISAFDFIDGGYSYTSPANIYDGGSASNGTLDIIQGSDAIGLDRITFDDMKYINKLANMTLTVEALQSQVAVLTAQLSSLLTTIDGGNAVA